MAKLGLWLGVGAAALGGLWLLNKGNQTNTTGGGYDAGGASSLPSGLLPTDTGASTNPISFTFPSNNQAPQSQTQTDNSGMANLLALLAAANQSVADTPTAQAALSGGSKKAAATVPYVNPSTNTISLSSPFTGTVPATFQQTVASAAQTAQTTGNPYTSWASSLFSTPAKASTAVSTPASTPAPNFQLATGKAIYVAPPAPAPTKKSTKILGLF